MAQTEKTVDHAERAHSELGASGAYRWWKCPGSVAAQRPYPNESNLAADEGTAAHELSERCFADGTRAADHIGEMLVVRNHTFECDEDFAESLDLYIDFVRDNHSPDLGDVMLVETRFDLSKQVLDGMFGTCDVIIYQPRFRRLMVIDLKFGKNHVVEAKGSHQLRYYALGAILTGEFDVDEIDMVIVQPRAAHPDGPIRRDLTSAMDLLEFKADLKDAALRALSPDAPRFSGSWCQFCRDEGACETRRKQAIADAKKEFAAIPVEDLESETISEVLAEARSIKSWVRAVEAEALRRLGEGREVPGQKLVAKRPRRKWFADEILVAQAIIDELGVDEDLLWERKLHSPRQMEMRLRDHKKALAAFSVKVSSGYTIAPVADKREAFIPAPGQKIDMGAYEGDDD